jgi:hypothetical protein
VLERNGHYSLTLLYQQQRRLAFIVKHFPPNHDSMPIREYCDNNPYEILRVIEKIYSDMNLSEWTNAGGSEFYFRALVAVLYHIVDSIAYEIDGELDILEGSDSY